MARAVSSENERSRFDPAKSEAKLGLRFRPVEATSEDEVAWLRAQGWLGGRLIACPDLATAENGRYRLEPTFPSPCQNGVCWSLAARGSLGPIGRQLPCAQPLGTPRLCECRGGLVGIMKDQRETPPRNFSNCHQQHWGAGLDHHAIAGTTPDANAVGRLETGISV